MRFDILTIFPKVFDDYLNESILKRAQKRELVKIKVWDLRKFAKDKHKKVDDRPYGGGPGMVLKIEPLARALDSILKIKNKKLKTAVVLLSPAGKQFNSKMAGNFAKKYNHIILIAGHYEGVDARIKKIFRAKEISIGPYVLTGGELPAMVIVDAITRHIPGVLGKPDSLEEKRCGIGVPVYTRPGIFKFKSKRYAIPRTMLSGNHKAINKWRKRHSFRKV